MRTKKFEYISASAVLKFGEHRREALLCDVRSELHGLGHGTEVLNLVIRYADYRGVDLWLKVQRNGDPRSGLSNAQLIPFYRRFGFVVVENTKPVMMVRKYSQGSQGL